MKNSLLRMIILPTLITLITGCGSPMEKDARYLAGIQKQKRETVRKMLGCRDSLQKIQLLDQVKRLEDKYARERKKCSRKYCDSTDQVDFEGYYREFLTNKSN